MENHNLLWENPLFLWPFSIAMLVHQRVTVDRAMLEPLNTPKLCKSFPGYSIHKSTESIGSRKVAQTRHGPG